MTGSATSPGNVDLAAKFLQLYGHLHTLEACAPGRVNLLGEHVDYNQGMVLPVAIDREVRLLAAPTTDGLVRLHALDLGQDVAFRLDQLGQKRDLQGNPFPHWAQYPAGVAWSLMQAGLPLAGMQAVYRANIPIGAGLSSSAAVEVAFATAWQVLMDVKLEKLALAMLCQRAENEYVGVRSGLMDQFASACGLEGHVLYLDTRSLDWSAYPLPPGTTIIIADSGIRRSLASSAYNDRRAACEQAVQVLKTYLPDVQSLRDVSTVEFAAYSTYLPPEIARRAEHVVKEIHRVEQAVIALKLGDVHRFGGFMFACHKSLRDLYEVSIPELDSLVEIARRLPGIYGARLTGAGFGGCTVNLVQEAQASTFAEQLHDQYYHQAGQDIAIYQCHASAGASANFI